MNAITSNKILYLFSTTNNTKWPFNEKCENSADTEIHCDECKLYPSAEDFDDLTKKEFEAFINKLKVYVKRFHI